GFEHRVGGRRGGRVAYLADAIEHERDRVRLAEIAAGFGEGGAHLARRPVAVVGERLDDDGDPARTIALVADLLEAFAAFAARAALDRALHGVLRHVGGPCRSDRRAKARVGGGVRKALPGRGLKLPDELREDLGALFVLRALPVHDVLELRM